MSPKRKHALQAWWSIFCLLFLAAQIQAQVPFGPPAARPRFADANAAPDTPSGGGGGYGVPINSWGGGGALGGVSQNTGVAAVAKNQLLISANNDKTPQVAVEPSVGGGGSGGVQRQSSLTPPAAPVSSIGTTAAAAAAKASSSPPKLSEAPQCEPLDPLSCNKNLMEVCSFSNGTYRCICPPNFSRLPDGRCLVANECFEAALNNCSIDATCTDQAIGYVCKCRDGFVDTSPDPAKAPGRSCKQNINECLQPQIFAVDCDSNAECKDTPEFFSCQCKSGFEDISDFFNLLPGRRCSAKGEDPCKNPKINDCSTNATCTNSKVGYTCQCKSGFVDVSPNVNSQPGRNCRQGTAAPPSARPGGGRGQKCDPKKGGDQCPNGLACRESDGGDFFCQCPPHTQELEGGICLVTDPCRGANVDCDTINGTCIPTPSGFSCQCKPGFKDIGHDRGKPGRKCIQPLNECADKILNDCSPFAECFDKDIGYECQCLKSFTDLSSRSNLQQGRRCVNVTNECLSRTSNACDENAKCIDTPEGYTCQCEEGYADVSATAGLPVGRVCTLNTQCPSQATDLIFLMDGSGSIGAAIFNQEVLRFVRDFSKLFDIGPDQTRIGVIQFSDTVRKEFDLNQFSTRASLENAITNIQYLTGLTRTGEAIAFMTANGFNEANGARPLSSKVHRVAIVVTDGRSQDNVTASSIEARRQGISMFAVGVTDHILETELEQIGGGKSRYYVVGSFQDLDQKLRALIQKEICPETGLPPGTCKTNNDCSRARNELCVNGKCECPRGFCRNPKSQQCGPVTVCDPNVNITCPSPLVCKETPFGVFRCACREDFTCDLNAGICLPPAPPKCEPPQALNPSLEKPKCENCDPFCDDRKNEFCIKEASGNFKCVCKQDFVRDLQSKLCIGDKCRNRPCDPNAKCDNTFDGFVCTCPPGFKDESPVLSQPGRVCTKIEDPCAKNNCSKNAKCIPGTLGGFFCVCNEGFFDLSPNINRFSGVDCQPDINECASPSANNCSANANCINLKIGYTCFCKQGFSDLDIIVPGRKCAIDPCQDANKNDCWMKRCRVIDMAAGTYTCDACPEGYKDASADRSKPGRTCVTELDACSDPTKNDCHPYAICMGLAADPTGFTCHCRDGYLDVSKDQNKKGRKCEEVKNLCVDATKNDCHVEATCVDLKNNSFTCQCRNGFKDEDVTRPGRKCKKIEQFCANPHKNTCSRFAKCIEKDGSYTCECLEGHADANPENPGRECVLIVDECANPALNDCDLRATCKDLRVLYNCSCEKPYLDESPLPDKPGRVCRYNGCASPEFNKCGPDAECRNLADRTLCICKQGFNDLDPVHPGIKCIKGIQCGSNVCNQTLSEACCDGSVCCCREGMGRREDGQPCVELVLYEMPLWVIRFNTIPVNFNSSFADTNTELYKLYAKLFVDGVANAFKKTAFWDQYVKSEVIGIQNPNSLNVSWENGLWFDFKVGFNARSPPPAYQAWKQLIASIITNFNYSVGGSPLFINEFIQDLACYKNNCPKDFICASKSDGSFTCLPGPNCGKDNCEPTLNEVCQSGQCVCPPNTARRLRGQQCVQATTIQLPFVVSTIDGSTTSWSTEFGPGGAKYLKLLNLYLEGMWKSVNATPVASAVLNITIPKVQNPKGVQSTWPEGILYTTSFSVVPGQANAAQLCIEIMKAIRANKDQIGASGCNIDKDFDPCADFRPTTTTTAASTTTTTKLPPCGDSVCRPELNEACVDGKCVCPPGQDRHDLDKPCSDVVEILMPLWVMRHNLIPLNFNSSYGDTKSDVFNRYVEIFNKGIRVAFDKAPCGPFFTSSEVREIKKPQDVNGTFVEGGLWTEFVVRFIKGNAPDPADCWRQVINVITKQFNYSIGGTPLFINPLSPDFACFQNDCPKSSWCVPQSDGHYECACPIGCKDDDKTKPGRKCTCNACLSPSSNNCHKNANCQPLDGGKYNCSCKVGYVDKQPLRGGPGRECVPDFCADLPFCPEKNASCANYGDRAECECLEGFENVRKSPNKAQFGLGDVFCLKPADVNECQLRIDECVAPAICVNLPIGYQCQCPNGKNIAPGIICPAESRALCEQCSYHGNCVSYDNSTTVCECETWYVGHTCATDVRVILAIIFAILFFLLCLLCCIYYCLRCRCWRDRRSVLAYNQMGSGSSTERMSAVGKDSDLYADFAIPRPKVKTSSLESAAVVRSKEEHESRWRREQMERQREEEARQRQLQAYLGDQQSTMMRAAGPPSVERVGQETVIFSDVHAGLPAGTSIRTRDDYMSESGSDETTSSASDWQEEYERRVTTDTKRTETTKTAAVSGATTAEFHVYPPNIQAVQGANGNEERRYLESSHRMTADRSIDETIESGQLARGSAYRGPGAPSEISEDDYNSVMSSGDNLAGERVYDKKTLVKRTQNFVPGANGRGGTQQFGSEVSTKVTKKDSKLL